MINLQRGSISVHWLEKLLDRERAFPPGTGIITAISHGDEITIFDSGHMDISEAAVPAGEIIFEIGSISKVFTTALLAIAIKEGKLSLQEAVRDLFPALSGWPAAVTLEHLATHTSGLPKMPPNIRRSMLRDRRNPYAAYSREDLRAFLRKFHPGDDLPQPVRYSNIGMSLLGHILEKAMGGNYADIITEKISRPLGLKSTVISLDAEKDGRAAPPHSSKGKRGAGWDLPAFEGAGGLHSTAADLIQFLRANMGIPGLPLVEALGICHTPRASDFAVEAVPRSITRWMGGKKSDTTSYRQAIGLGWSIGSLRSSGSELHWHHGATGGYRAFAGFCKAAAAGVVVLANSGLSLKDALLNTTSTDRVGFAILEHLTS